MSVAGIVGASETWLFHHDDLSTPRRCNKLFFRQKKYLFVNKKFSLSIAVHLVLFAPLSFHPAQSTL